MVALITRTIPSAASVTPIPSGAATRSWIARSAESRSRVMPPPSSVRVPSRPSTKSASVTVGSVPPVP